MKYVISEKIFTFILDIYSTSMIQQKYLLSLPLQIFFARNTFAFWTKFALFTLISTATLHIVRNHKVSFRLSKVEMNF